MRGPCCKVLLSAVTSVLMLAHIQPSSAETVVNNVLSPFSTVKILGSRPGPKPHWTPECNQGFTGWKPVCAVTLNRVVVTYPNQCMAQLDNAVIIDERPCPIAVNCAPTYEPVCGRPERERPVEDLADALRPPIIRTYINECFARAHEVIRLSPEMPPTLDPELYGHVTVIRRYGDDLYQYSLPEHLHEQRYLYYGRSGIEIFGDVCPRTCPEGGLVVCAVDHNNVPRLYKNRCSAVLDGADPTRFPIGDVKSCK